MWGLNLPPKFALFIWKVIHRILPVREVLVRKGMVEDVLCPVCGLGRVGNRLSTYFLSAMRLDGLAGRPVNWV